MDTPASDKAKSPRVFGQAPAPVAAKAALYLAMRQAGISKIGAKNGGCGIPKRPTKLPRMQEALDVFGKRLLVIS